METEHQSHGQYRDFHHDHVVRTKDEWFPSKTENNVCHRHASLRIRAGRYCAQSDRAVPPIHTPLLQLPGDFSANGLSLRILCPRCTGPALQLLLYVVTSPVRNNRPSQGR